MRQKEHTGIGRNNTYNVVSLKEIESVIDKAMPKGVYSIVAVCSSKHNKTRPVVCVSLIANDEKYKDALLEGLQKLGVSTPVFRACDGSIVSGEIEISKLYQFLKEKLFGYDWTYKANWGKHYIRIYNESNSKFRHLRTENRWGRQSASKG